MKEDIPVTVRDVVNARQKYRLRMLAGRLLIHELLSELRQDGCAYDYDADMNLHLTRLFFASCHFRADF